MKIREVIKALGQAGCVATGPTRDDVLAEIRDAIAFTSKALLALPSKSTFMPA